ncbi:DUF222 domain-containing protein [Brachybacterium sp. AOP3-A1-3]|uniref:DUF222 domain-containing protein n=1 Tax=Brachybacterium sp. AOP3-A1-3 TaxID=3457699 RepID=UPI004033B54F
MDLPAVLSALVHAGGDGSQSIERLSAQATLSLLAGLREVSTAIAAVQARALVRLEGAVKDECLAQEMAPRMAVKTARAEAAFALHAAPAVAGQTMSSSRRLVQSMPGMLRALAHGRLSPEAAHRVGRVVGPASPELRSQVDQVLTEHLPYLEGCGVQQWGDEAEKVMHALDPEGAAARHTHAVQSRNVSVRRAENGMSVVTARLTALDGARIRKSLALEAERARAHGDRRGHQQIMADMFADTLLGRSEGMEPATMEIGVIITDRSLFVPGHADPAVVEGLGTVPYEHIRDEMRRAMASAGDDPELRLALRNLYTDPEDGQLVAAEARSRAFPPALARFLRWSHITCRAPYCDAPIRQNDHITPYAAGGATSVDNGNGLCGIDTQKEEEGVRAEVIHDDTGHRRTVEWTTRYGQKARRSGINFDPVGTARRRRHRRLSATERAASVLGDPEQVAPRESAAMPPVADPPEQQKGWVTYTLGELEPTREGGPTPPDSHAIIHRAICRLIPTGILTRRPPDHPGKRLLCAHSDYVFDATLPSTRREARDEAREEGE